MDSFLHVSTPKRYMYCSSSPFVPHVQTTFDLTTRIILVSNADHEASPLHSLFRSPVTSSLLILSTLFSNSLRLYSVVHGVNIYLYVKAREILLY